MKLKLLHKLFFANLGIIFILVLGLLASSYYSSKFIFSDHIHNMETKAAQILAKGLANYYEKNNSWSAFITQREFWYAISTSQLMNSTLMPVATSKKSVLSHQLIF